MARVAIIANDAFSLVNFRGPLIRAMAECGNEVFALAPLIDERHRAALRSLGAVPVDIPMDRLGFLPFKVALEIIRLAKLLRGLRIDLSFSYFLKPVIVGSIASWLAGVPRRHALIAGLGYVYTPLPGSNGLRRRALQRVVTSALAQALRLCRTVFFQNEDDRDFFVHAGAVAARKTRVVAGTGVDLERFAVMPLPHGRHRVLFVGRLLREKGVYELIEAARIVRGSGHDCVIALAGGADTNPGALAKEEIEQLQSEGVCEWLGQVADIRAELARAHVFVLPSYREGKPRSTQEALAMGRPVITTDAVGCRDTVVPGWNGWIVPVGDASALAKAIADSAIDRARLERMGENSRSLAEQQFNVAKINAVMLTEMGLEPEASGAVRNSVGDCEAVW